MSLQMKAARNTSRSWQLQLVAYSSRRARNFAIKLTLEPVRFQSVVFGCFARVKSLPQSTESLQRAFACSSTGNAKQLEYMGGQLFGGWVTSASDYVLGNHFSVESKAEIAEFRHFSDVS